MSDRIEALADVLRARVGEKAAAQSAGLLSDLLIRRFALLSLLEIPPELRDEGIIVRIAAELETCGKLEASTRAVMDHSGTQWKFYDPR